MGLYAWVNCNCVETGRLRIPHPVPTRLSIDRTGEPSLISHDRDELMLHYAWHADTPCAHVNGVLLAHDLGTTAVVERILQLIAALVEEPTCQFPVLCTEILVDGFHHDGDCVRTQDLDRLAREVQQLSALAEHRLADADQRVIHTFVGQVVELIDAARLVTKPIGRDVSRAGPEPATSRSDAPTLRGVIGTRDSAGDPADGHADLRPSVLQQPRGGRARSSRAQQRR